MLKFIRAIERKIFNVNDLFGIQILTRMKLVLATFVSTNLSAVLKGTLNPTCICSIESETTIHSITTLTPISFSSVSDNYLISSLLYDHDEFDDTKNRKILVPTIRFITDSQRADDQLFW